MENKLFVGVVLILLLTTVIAGCKDKPAVEAKPIEVEISNDSPMYEVDTTTNETTVILTNETIPEDEDDWDDEPEATIAYEGDFEIIDKEPEVTKKPTSDPAPIKKVEAIHGINITFEETFYGTIQDITKRDNTSIFEIIEFKISTAAEDAGYRPNVAKDDSISFKVTNKDDRDYYITYIKPKDSEIFDALKIAVNGHRISDIDEKCGSRYIKSGETLTCKNVPAILKVGLDIRFIEYINIITADSTYMESKLMFKILEEDTEE